MELTAAELELVRLTSVNEVEIRGWWEVAIGQAALGGSCSGSVSLAGGPSSAIDGQRAIDPVCGAGAARRPRRGLELHVAVLELPLVVLLEQDGADQPDDGRLVREDADDIGPPLDLLVQPLQRVRAVQLGPVLDGKGHVGEHLVLSVVHECGELRP